MEFPFNEKKAAQAAAVIVARAGGAHNYLSLVKLLYLADRRSLIETGSPITGDQACAMRFGPVLSKVMRCLKAEGGYGEIWAQYVSQQSQNRVFLTDRSGDYDELCDYEVEVLEEIRDQHAGLTPGQLIELVHKLPEWSDPGSGVRPIAPEDILRAGRVPEIEIEAAAVRADALMRAVGRGGSGI